MCRAATPTARPVARRNTPGPCWPPGLPPDTDHDGLPDAWETAHKLNPKDPADRGKTGPGGYPMLEVYLAELAGK